MLDIRDHLNNQCIKGQKEGYDIGTIWTKTQGTNNDKTLAWEGTNSRIRPANGFIEILPYTNKDPTWCPNIVFNSCGMMTPFSAPTGTVGHEKFKF